MFPLGTFSQCLITLHLHIARKHRLLISKRSMTVKILITLHLPHKVFGPMNHSTSDSAWHGTTLASLMAHTRNRSHGDMWQQGACPHCLTSLHFHDVGKHHCLIFLNLIMEGTIEKMWCHYNFISYSFGPTRLRDKNVLACIVRKSNKT